MATIKVSAGLCEFAGAMIGNGNLWSDGSRYRVELTGNSSLDRAYFEYLFHLAVNLFGKEPYPLRVHQRALRLRLQSKEAYQLLLALGIPEGSGKAHNAALPFRIMREDWSLIRWTIRGIMDTDGTLFFSKKTYKKPVYPTLEIRTCSKKLANQLETLLSNRGFRARKRGNENQGFHVALYGNEMLEKWLAEIGFSNSKHANKVVLRKL